MRYSFASAALLSAFTISEVVAGPAHHAHRHLHEKKDIIGVEKRADMVVATIDGVVVSWVNNYFGETATTAPSSPAATNVATTTTAATVSTATSTASSTAGLWDDLVGFSNSLTAFGGRSTTSGSAGDDYYGNCGVPYGSNIIKVDSRTGYSYTNEFINTSGESMTVVVWNKIGSDGQVLSGSALAPKSPALTFVLDVGASQIVAFDEDSQVGWAQAVSKFAASGAFATSWGEANFVSTGSGYDLSAIMNADGNDYSMTITSTEASCISDMTQNYWLTATDPVGDSDGSCYIAQDTATLTTKMGGTV